MKALIQPAQPDLRVPVLPKSNVHRHLPPEGLELELTTYWHRRAAAGEVTIQPITAAPAAPKEKE